MRRIITGIDASGRSYATEDAELVLAPAGDQGIASATAAVTTSSPPPARVPDGSEPHELGIAPGEVRWAIARFPAGLFLPAHTTDSVDYDTVLEGSLEIGLDDGQHVLEAGDIVIVNGVSHTWTAGPDGCLVSFLQIGTPPPA